MSSDYPDLVGYDDDFLVRAFRLHCPAPQSVEDARCMQNAYTILREFEVSDQDNFYVGDPLHLISSIPEPIVGASIQGVNDFLSYIQALGKRGGWEFVDNLMGDPKKCGALYCDVGIRNARIAQRYMATLAAEPDMEKTRGVMGVFLPERPVEYRVAETFWSYHLSSSPPGDPTLTSLLRTLTPWSILDVSSHLHTEQASRIVEWLKVFCSHCNTCQLTLIPQSQRSQDPPADLVARWQSLAVLRRSYAASQ